MDKKFGQQTSAPLNEIGPVRLYMLVLINACSATVNVIIQNIKSPILRQAPMPYMGYTFGQELRIECICTCKTLRRDSSQTSAILDQETAAEIIFES